MSEKIRRSSPFWAWNGKLNKKEIKKQVKCFKKAGYGGFFMHARTGLITEYLGKNWFSAVKTAVKEAKRQGLSANIYDEDRYPSGSCGGKVGIDERFVEKKLCLSVTKEFVVERYDNVSAVFSAIFDGEDLVSYKPYRHGDEGVILVFYVARGERSSLYNGGGYADLLDASVTEKFLSLTHDEYYKHCKNDFGKTIKAIFTDEAHYPHAFCEEIKENGEEKNKKIPYTPALFSAFESKYGYSLKERLPELFFRKKGESLRKIAWEYFELLTELFTQNFAAKNKARSEKYDLKFTGHVLQEDTLSSQTVCCGSCMRFYKYMDIPGVDVLCENIGNEHIIKQAESVKKQLGKSGVAAECYGATGYGVSLDGYRRMSDIISVHGADFKVPHLALYTMKGRCKRDYPGNLFFQTDGYEELRVLEERNERLGEYLSKGKPVTETLVISPLESVWASAYCGAFEDETFSAVAEDIKDIENNFMATFRSLTERHIDFDYADEGLLSEYGMVEKGENPFLVVGEAKYRYVLVCDNPIMRKTTFSLLKEFAEAGGKVVVKNPPQLVDFAKTKVSDFDKFVTVKDFDSVCKRLVNSFRVIADKDLVIRARKTDKGYIIFIVRPQKDGDIKTYSIAFPGMFSVHEINLFKDRKEFVCFRSENGNTVIESEFCAGQARLFVADDSIISEQTESVDYESFSLKDEFEFELDSYNVLLLDRVKMYVNGRLQGENYVLSADEILRNEFCLEQKKEMMTQPYALNETGRYDKKICDLTLEYFFVAEHLPDKLLLAVEKEDNRKLLINGVTLVKKSREFWTDNCFDLFAIPKNTIKRGQNVITLCGEFFDKTDIEAIYLLGNFGVDKDTLSIVPMKNKLAIGDATRQGLPFYNGKIIYKTGLKTGVAKISVGKIGAFSVVANFGLERENITFPPYESDWHKVTNELRLEVSLSGGNVFGTVHNKNRNAEWNGPFNFINRMDGNFTDNYVLRKAGLLSAPQVKIAVVEKDAYRGQKI